MKKNLIWVIIILILGGIIYFWSKGGDKVGTENPNTISSELTTYFTDKVIGGAIALVGQPIEGFDSTFIVRAFPKIKASDFQGVKTLEGHYEVSGDTVNFVRDRQDIITSVEKAISPEGFGILLANISKRLGQDVKTQADVDVLIQKIDGPSTTKTENVDIKMNEEKEVMGVKIKPLSIVEDSRCPIDVQCIQAGTVRVKTTLTSGMGSAEQVFELNKPITTEAEQVELMGVLPQTNSKTKIAAKDYVFSFQVSKR